MAKTESLVKTERQHESFRICTLRSLAEAETNGGVILRSSPFLNAGQMYLPLILYELREDGLVEITSSGPRLTELGWAEVTRSYMH